MPRFDGQMEIGGSGSLGQLLASFEADRREVADRRVATAGIVPALDVVEDGEAALLIRTAGDVLSALQ